MTDDPDQGEFPRRRRPWGWLIAAGGFALGAPFAFGAIKITPPDAARLTQAPQRATLAGSVPPQRDQAKPPCTEPARTPVVTRAQPAF